jgi:hypothetical protein
MERKKAKDRSDKYVMARIPKDDWMSLRHAAQLDSRPTASLLRIVIRAWLDENYKAR